MLARETGTIWKIGVLAAGRSVFLPKNADFRPFRTIFFSKKPVKWRSGLEAVHIFVLRGIRQIGS